MKGGIPLVPDPVKLIVLGGHIGTAEDDANVALGYIVYVVFADKPHPVAVTVYTFGVVSGRVRLT